MALYIGGGSTGGPGFGGPIVHGPINSGGPGNNGTPVGGPRTPLPGIDPSKSGRPGAPRIGNPPVAAPTPTPAGVLPAQSLRPTGSSGGFDPSYLQNLTTAIGGLFSRPNGNLSFNPLGDLSNISQSTGFGNAPVPGLPSTLLQDAINGLAFLFNQPKAVSSTGSMGAGGSSGGGNSNISGGRFQLQ